MTKKRKGPARQGTGTQEKPAPVAPGGGAPGAAVKTMAPSAGAVAEGATPSRTLYDSVRENIEAFVVAVILALIIRHFVVEAFEIPTGSMATTLYGIHAKVECANCPTVYAVSLGSDSSTGKVNDIYRPMTVYRGECPNPKCTLSIHEAKGAGSPIECAACGTVFPGKPDGYVRARAHLHAVRCPVCHKEYADHVFEERNQYGGHKILVNKFAFMWGDPRRWDVIVFEFDQWKNYIKRLVGLPGERIDIWDGDLYVNGRIERKSSRPSVQDSIWTRISDSDVPEGGLNGTAAWAEVPHEKTARWDPDGRRWSLNGLGDVSLIEYRRGFDNYYSYNTLKGTHGYPPNVQVGDKKVSFTVALASTPPPSPGAPRKEGWVGAEIRDGDFTFQLRLPAGPGAPGRPAVLERIANDDGSAPSPLRPSHPAGLRTEAPAPEMRPGEPIEVELENVDDRIAARVGGREILAMEYTSLPEGSSLARPPRAPGEEASAHRIRLIAAGAQAELHSIRVYRDIYYIPQNQFGLWQWQGIQLGPGEYFAMGDNAPSSADSRYWKSVPEKNLMGRALLVFWPALPTNFELKLIR